MADSKTDDTKAKGGKKGQNIDTTAHKGGKEIASPKDDAAGKGGKKGKELDTKSMKSDKPVSGSAQKSTVQK
jgi:hypothetical protein